MAEFQIHRCLGRGGFGEVYRGVMSRGGGIAMDVAIKVLRPDLEPSSQGVQRLRDEGRLLGRLTHPTILRVYDLVILEGRAALITEFVDGDDLARIIRTESRPSPRAIYEITAQVAAALDAAWSWPSVTDGQPLHLVHRDIKPDNIRLDPHGVVKLLDFGIAQAATVEREAETSVNIIMGSAQYLAPERLVQQEVGPEADVFALGCTLYEALTGEALFHRKSMRQMYVLMCDGTRLPPFLDERLAPLTDMVSNDRALALLRDMLSYRKEDRPTASEVAARCDLVAESLGGITLRRWSREHDWPKPPEATGPLEGRVFTSVQSLPAPEARTLALRAPGGDEDPTTHPDLAQALAAEQTAPFDEYVRDARRDDPVHSPWSASEVAALMGSAHTDDEVDDDAPTVQVRLRDLQPPPEPEEAPLEAPEDDDDSDDGRITASREVPFGDRTDGAISLRAINTYPTFQLDSDAALAADDEADSPTLGDPRDAPLPPALPEPTAPAPEARALDASFDDLQPGAIDLSDVVPVPSADVEVRVLPPGAAPTAPPSPSSPPKRRRAPPTNPAGVMFLSGMTGVVVGAVVISGIAFVTWLIAG